MSVKFTVCLYYLRAIFINMYMYTGYGQMSRAMAEEGDPMMERRERPTYNWEDITSEFKDAASQLALGELLHDSS